jgi:hypothetical protein
MTHLSLEDVDSVELEMLLLMPLKVQSHITSANLQ